MSQSLLLKQVSTLSEKPPEPCSEFGMDASSLSQLRAAVASGPVVRTSKRIAIINTASKDAQALMQPGISPNGSLGSQGTPGTRSPVSPQSLYGSPTPGSDIFDEADEDSKKNTSNGSRKKRKVPSDGDWEREGDGPESGFRPPAASANKKQKGWMEPKDRSDKNKSPAHIQELVDKHRKNKRTTDQSLAKDPHNVALIDGYWMASLGFFEAAALYELQAKTEGDTQSGRLAVSMALDLYKGLVTVPFSDKPSLLTYYISLCKKAGLTLRIVLAQRFLAMAHSRLWNLHQKQLNGSYLHALKAAANKETTEVKSSLLTDMADVFQLNDYYNASEREARLHQSAFSPFPSHPIELDPFDFIDFIREEFTSVEKAENPDTLEASRSKRK